ncbi:protein of unknown function [Caballeronia sp. S22]
MFIEGASAQSPKLFQYQKSVASGAV